MPHSGGRVGKGIYLASENSKSAGYVRSDYKSKTGIMFLCEGAMGKEAKIFRDDSSLVKPPKGFDSVLAVGASEPDPSKDATMKIDGKNVVIPQGKVISQTDSLLALCLLLQRAVVAACARRRYEEVLNRFVLLLLLLLLLLLPISPFGTRWSRMRQPFRSRSTCCIRSPKFGFAMRLRSAGASKQELRSHFTAALR
jgi:hypothetical protein